MPIKKTPTWTFHVREIFYTFLDNFDRNDPIKNVPSWGESVFVIKKDALGGEHVFLSLSYITSPVMGSR